MSSDRSVRPSKDYPPQQSSRFPQPTSSYGQPQAPEGYRGSNAQPTSSHTAFFSSQTAFYPSSSDQQMPGMEFLPNNPILQTVFQHGMKDFAQRTANVLPDGMKKSLSSIKYYFAVNQTYVFQKLCLLLFPFRSRTWSVAYNADEPVPPCADTNAPDYYIPLMSAITYVLVAGLILGTQNKFTPEQLGMHASSVLVWNIIENCFLCLICFLFHVQSKLRTLDLIAYCGYKYVGMIAALSSYLLTHSVWIYRFALLYVSLSISYFLMKSLRLQILPETGGSYSDGHKRRIYLLLLIIILQPIFIWYLTRHLILV